MRKTLGICLFFLYCCNICFSQDEPADSSKTMGEVVIKAFEQNRLQSSSAALVKIIGANNGDRYNKTSLVNGFNTIAGVRMEERSPGSYRINIRGSSLRSPFGVRNVKVYWNDIPLTDPGGNTYFNQLAWNNFSSIEIFKGPASSLYGAGTGGLILIHNLDHWQRGADIEYLTGNYNLQNILASTSFGKHENKNQISFAHNQSDGYRQQSYMRRDNVSSTSRIIISDRQLVTLSVLFTDLYYQTPGALTLSEFITNPKSARPAAGGFPSAIAAKAAIFQKNLLAGFTNEYDISPRLRNSTSFYSAYAEIKNPTFRNYERRIEPHFGGRSSFIFTKTRVRDNGVTENWKWVLGTEFQEGYFTTQVSKNKNGSPDSLLTDDDIRYADYSVFMQADMNIAEKWFGIAGMSLNNTRVGFTRFSVSPVVSQGRRYHDEITPRFSLMRKTQTGFSILATISRGYSPPTIAELLPSTGTVSTNLEAEYGWNYEISLRQSLFKKKLLLEATSFIFRLNNALVQRRDASGADYFVNAGDIKERGLEFHAGWLSTAHSKAIDWIELRADLTCNHFRYGSFVKGSDNFSGKILPSVPATTFSFLTDLQFSRGWYTNITLYCASKIFLNDANTISAASYQLLDARLGWKKTVAKKLGLNFYTGVDNLLNQHYSLGNDINAAGGRYYNAAPERNYYIGILFRYFKTEKNYK